MCEYARIQDPFPGSPLWKVPRLTGYYSEKAAHLHHNSFAAQNRRHRIQNRMNNRPGERWSSDFQFLTDQYPWLNSRRVSAVPAVMAQIRSLVIKRQLTFYRTFTVLPLLRTVPGFRCHA